MATKVVPGKKYGRLVVESLFGVVNRIKKWNCACECGQRRVVAGHGLTSGNSTSCGCLQTELRYARTLDITGQKFGKLTAIRGEAGEGRGGRPREWVCRCECGKTARVPTARLRNGNTTSCGCYKAQRQGDAARTHGMSGTPLYLVWSAMIARCCNPNSKSYPHYGAKGISVCPRWRDSFADFHADMGDRPSDAHSLDRIDPAGDYEPSNVRWATPKEQARNRKKSKRIEWAGLSLTAADWGERLGISGAMILRRLRRGWTAERALAAASIPGGVGAEDVAKGDRAVEAISEALRPIYAALLAEGWSRTGISVLARRALRNISGGTPGLPPA